MEQSLSRTVPIPIKAALTVALLTTAALAVVAVLMLRIDMTAREYSAAERAEREFADLAEKLPGLMEDPEMAEMGRAALVDLGDVAREAGQERIVAVRGGAEQLADWPESASSFSEDYLRFTRDGDAYAGFRQELADGSEVLVAYPVRSTGPLTSAFLRWGLIIAGVVVATAGLVALVTGASISRRIARLNALCERVQKGEVTARSPVTTADEIGTLASHMNTMLDELQRRLEALRDTADGLAHDLRTPLSRVQTRLSRLEEIVSDERGIAEIRLATKELERLMEAFNALLELREIETQGAPSVSKFRVEKAVEDAIELYEAVAEDERNVRIVRHFDPCEAVGNASLIVRAVANLLDNAINASPKGGTIEVRTSCQAGVVTITVQDQGPGLASPTKANANRGYGIGLRIVRAVARRHAGWFTLSDRASGARAELALPGRAAS